MDFWERESRSGGRIAFPSNRVAVNVGTRGREEVDEAVTWTRVPRVQSFAIPKRRVTVRAPSDDDFLPSLQKYHGEAAAKEGPSKEEEPMPRRRHLSFCQSKLDAESRAARPLNAEDHLRILYHDDHICVCDKPGGILSVPGPRRNPSLADLVRDALITTTMTTPSSLSESDRIAVNTVDRMVVHRLDMETSGVIVYALTVPALKKLHRDFRSGNVKKTYEALLRGHMVPLARKNRGDRHDDRQQQPPSGSFEVEIDLWLERDPDNPPFMRVARPPFEPREQGRRGRRPRFLEEPPKPSRTDLVVRSLEYCRSSLLSQEDGGGDDCFSSPLCVPVTRVSLTPHTGRTHQLRVHCRSLGFPILGDTIYSADGDDFAGGTFAAFPYQQDEPDLRHPDHGRLCLHARELCLFHPHTGAPMMFECDPPF